MDTAGRLRARGAKAAALAARMSTDPETPQGNPVTVARE